MTEQEIEKLRDKLGSDYSVKRLNGAITVELVDEQITANITSFTLSNPYSTIVFTTSHTIGHLDQLKFANHIEEAIETYLNKKP